ncbi:DUF1772 domain-containing protein [Streptacidiphilus sp. PB12-B1b]|uniref:anthrone oxygenase family protein n=1 Tax=Streptacidiphilus sp. PB12-B1b TaxID=2705012 RepID=UPI0015FC1DD9|nr:anthrone oxygenase family protein [Streptacidiphilus sp. PB12-B1b]QMU77913.1 DUF1772 domain-containing protein [Streptacidiphilus sp. PB12-B1b]
MTGRHAVRALELLNLFFAGLLAGAEFAVRFGLRPAIGILEQQPSIVLRQALIRSLRLVVPSVYLPTALTGAAVTVWNGGGSGFAAQCAAMAAVLVWTLATFTGTVPINSAILDGWQADAPPADWRATLRSWERLDTLRTAAAVAALALFLTAVGLQSA